MGNPQFDAIAEGLARALENTSFDRMDDATIEVIVRRGLEQTRLNSIARAQHKA